MKPSTRGWHPSRQMGKAWTSSTRYAYLPRCLHPCGLTYRETHSSRRWAVRQHCMTLEHIDALVSSCRSSTRFSPYPWTKITLRIQFKLPVNSNGLPRRSTRSTQGTRRLHITKSRRDPRTSTRLVCAIHNIDLCVACILVWYICIIR